MRDDPSSRDKPLAVGGYGMISTTNYVARKFSVRAAMPGFIGKKLCPELVFVKPNFDKYAAVAEEIRSIFREYDVNFTAWSLDETYLDIAAYYLAHKERYLGETLADGSISEQERAVCAITNEMRSKIYEKTHLTASAGIACNETLAKVSAV